MSDKTQPSSRKDGFGAEGIGENGDAGTGVAGSSRGGTGAPGSGPHRGAELVPGAHGEEDGAPGRRNPANKQGIPGQQD